MVALIFEGPDNLGKSTIINKIVTNFKDTRDIIMMHSTGPHNDKNEDPFEFQLNSFKAKAFKLAEASRVEADIPTKYNASNIAIMDRSWYGEYVYGQLYRDANPDRIIDCINSCEECISMIPHVVINLMASLEFIIAHDDNKSITSNMVSNKRLESVKKELSLFGECFSKLTNVNVLNINVEGKDFQYRNIEDIYNDIISGVKSFNVEL